ncbi:non-ribosomal peptide synthetase [Pseudomonas chlororaphis]|uniref:non-ribosomal peptide synthetase n=1 Tax=Pseudomonas chlororaphis TaxID=587753 RepID=UPI0003D35FB1|nr:non-ribosomal peptide synthetase [Pseudomonas chlororaphis]AZD29879.1 Polyketide synthase [Pseudomonas chlororaphis]ETD39274.1 peptide synthetase [Pseudomonas chlororaphis subsp. aurantiaca PB-St2]QFS55319.1 non-ribosomal peptide synthetase [Pseudomonas chlororaphis subsp. aurantiaca]
MNKSTMQPFDTFLDVVRHRAAPDSGSAGQLAFSYLDDGESVSQTLTFAQLDQQARSLAAHLQRHTQPGDRVLLVYPPCVDYIVAFYACVYAGVIAVPALSPANAKTLPRLHLLAVDSQPALALTIASVLGGLERMAAVSETGQLLQDLTWLASDTLMDASAQWHCPPTGASDIVFLQYTSGSTGAPKGVMVSHANLLANVELSRQTYGIREQDVFVSWLPAHHDFGLIGAIILPVYMASHCVQFPPSAFVMRPYRWLKLICDYRARITGGPNFAFQLCVQRISDEQKRTLDLSSLEIAVNGAERIRPATLRSFVEAFAPCGLQPQAMVPAYGMAESVLLVTANMKTAAGHLAKIRSISKSALENGEVKPQLHAADAVETVATGSEFTGSHRVGIFHPESARRLAPEQVGEVWISGPSTARGYWQREEESRVFQARAEDDEHPWFRTGDLGFLSDGDLYITGRLKEVMIFSGRNIYPQDVEMTVEAMDPAFRANGCAAFAIEDGETSQLVVVQELEARQQADTATLVARLQAELAERHEIFDLSALLLVKTGAIPRTSSGKIQRSRCRQLFQATEIKTLWAWTREHQAQEPDAPDTASHGDIEERLLPVWQATLDRQDISYSDSFFLLGGHSLLATQMMMEVRRLFDVELPLSTLFHSPSLRALAGAIATAKSQAGPALPAITRAAGNDALPLSYAQQRFWFLDQYQPDNPFYSLPLALTIDGPLDGATVQQVLDLLVARHAPLRTRFESTGGLLRQNILARLDVPVSRVDFSQYGDAAAARITAAIRDEAYQPFNLAQGPLIRARLLQSAPQRHVLLLTLHHIICDGWSSKVLLNEFSALYEALVQGRPSPLAPLAIEYADYTVWEQRHLAGPWLEEQLAFWRTYLEGAPLALDLQTDFARHENHAQAGDVRKMEVPQPVVHQLETFAREHNATLFMVMVSAMNVLLHRMSGQDDFCIGVMSANRPQGTEGLVGNFINVVPLRSRISGDECFAALLDSTAYQLLDTYDRQIPFELILKHLVPSRQATGTPFAQVVMNFHNELAEPQQPLARGERGSIAIAGHHPSTINHAAFELKVEVQAAGDSLEIAFEYNKGLYSPSSIERMMRHFLTLLASATAQPRLPVRNLALLADAEQRQLISQWNDTQRDFPAHQTLHQLFQQQVERSPDAVALVFEEQQLSYAQLNARANQLARQLIALGVMPDSRVALCLERSPQMVVALLAILKAGGAYVPLDPGYPADRLAYMLEDSSPVVLISQQELRHCLPQHSVPTFWLDAAQPAIARYSTANLDIGDARCLAYCIYTSGSTGRPKGAMNAHGAVVNRLLWMQEQYGLSVTDRVLQKTPFSFDVSVWEFFWTLLHGARLIICKPEGHKDPAYLQGIIEQHGVTTAHFVPSMLQAFLKSVKPLASHSLRQVFSSGEALPVAVANQFLEDYPRTRLYNLYGPTEAAVDVTHWECLPGYRHPLVPIGRPVANTRMYILDDALQPVPVGVIGNLYIAGVQLARGYLGRPDLTAERFIPDPYDRDGRRMYLTGDRGRYLPSGDIQYLGRIDHQIKIRGFRIELGEIENALLHCPSVREAVVVPRTDALGDPCLVAFITSSAPDINNAQLRQQLGKSLPDYMLPSFFVRLDALPLNANGKIDRQALPATGHYANAPAEPYLAPATATEKTLVEIWQEALKHPRIGVNDSFFELGGHSLLATQILARTQELFSVSPPLKLMFESPTIAAMAAHIDQAGRAPRAAPPIRRLARNQSVE